MSKYYSMFLLLTTVAFTTATNFSSPAPSPSTVRVSPPPSPSQSSPEYMQEQQIKNIIDALIGAGDFAAWANILFNPGSNSSTPPTSTIPNTATMFVPGNDALSRLSGAATGAYTFDPFIIPYHVIPQRFTFSELQLFKTQTRIPTLLPSKTVLITDNNPSHFTIDDSLVIQPDIYCNSAVCVHGVANILDYKIYGGVDQTPVTFIPPPQLPPLPPADETVTPPPSTNSSSDIEFLIPVVHALCSFFILVILFWE